MSAARRHAARHPLRSGLVDPVRAARDTPWSVPPRRTVIRREPESALVRWGRAGAPGLVRSVLASTLLLIVVYIFVPALLLVFE